MRVLNLSLDSKILAEDSAVERRMLALAEKTGEITVLVPSEKDEMKIISPHLAVYAVGGFKLRKFLKLWRRASTTLHERPYNLITVQDIYFLGFLAVQLGKRFSVPVEVQVHGLEQFSGFRRLIAGFVLRRADMIRVVSERLKRELGSRFTIHDSRMYILPVYTQIETPQRPSSRKTVPYPFTFLTVGRLVPVKNIGLQLRAFATLVKEVPHCKLRIVGDGPERRKLELEARRLQLEAFVNFEGFRNDVGRCYDEADAFLLTSDYEGWGRVALEASAYRLPIIMTDVGLAREVIKNEESGFIIPVGDERQLVLAMREFLDKPELRARLGAVAFKVFKSLPSQENQIRKQVEHWRSLQ